MSSLHVRARQLLTIVLVLRQACDFYIIYINDNIPTDVLRYI